MGISAPLDVGATPHGGAYGLKSKMINCCITKILATPHGGAYGLKMIVIVFYSWRGKLRPMEGRMD